MSGLRIVDGPRRSKRPPRGTGGRQRVRATSKDDCKNGGWQLFNVPRVFKFVLLAQRSVATNAEHAGIILVPSTFRGDEFQAIADGICRVLDRFPRGLRGLVIYIRRKQRS